MQFGFRNKRLTQRFQRWSLAVIFWLAASGLAAPGERFQDGPLPATQTAPADGSLESVLAGMDQAAALFTSVMGKLEYTKVTVIVDDHSTEKGKIYFEKRKGGTRVMIAFEEPAEKFVLFAGGTVSIYRPKIAEVEEYSVGKRQDLLEQFLLLGFGTSGQELQKSYRIRLLEEEALDGQRAFRLELVPKSEPVSARLQRMELWISPETWQPLQQKFFEPTQDYLIARYSDLKRNVKIPAKNFRLPLRAKVRTVHH